MGSNEAQFRKLKIIGYYRLLHCIHLRTKEISLKLLCLKDECSFEHDGRCRCLQRLNSLFKPHFAVTKHSAYKQKKMHRAAALIVNRIVTIQ